MQQKTLTVVIPTYNMEKYLRRCLDSLIVDDERMAQLEVIVVNDGSKDSSSSIAHEYEKKYPQTFRVIDKENGNYGSCVNRSLREAKGKYIKVLDADDWFNTNNFKIYLNELQNLDVDLIITNVETVSPDNKVLSRSIFKFKPHAVTTFDDMMGYPQFKNMEMHAVTYKTQNLIDINYKQTEGISYTDQEWMFLPMTAVNKVYYIDVVIYEYLLGREGQTCIAEVFKKSAIQLEKVINGMIDVLKVWNGKNKDYLYFRVYRKLVEQYSLSLVSKTGYGRDNESLIEFDSMLRKKDISLYNAVASEKIHRRYNFLYIKWWREHNHENIPARVMFWYSVIRKLGGWKAKIKKIFN